MRLGRELPQRARAGSGRAADTVFGGHEQSLRQTVIAFTEGAALSEHESPGEATLLVLSGRVRLTADKDEWQGRGGDPGVVVGVHRVATAETPLRRAAEQARRRRLPLTPMHGPRGSAAPWAHRAGEADQTTYYIM